MRATGTHRHDRGRQGSYGSYAPRGAPMYYGWSHDESRMQMMDLPDYLDSFRLGYERAIGDLQSQLANVTQAYMPGGYAPAGPAGWFGYAPSGPYQPQPGRRGQYHGGHHPHHDHGCDCECHDRHHGHDHHDHGHDHDHHGHGCGCGKYDCRCDCCIVDADYVVYARCFERRVVPIQIENDTRKVREDVTLDVSEVRTAGGRTLPWKVNVLPQSPLTLEPCSETEIDLVVEIECRDPSPKPEPQDQPVPGKKSAAQKAADAKEAEAEDAQRTRDFEPVDVDDCEVGYVTIRVGGCLVRPIVVAIAVLPRDCDAYHAFVLVRLLLTDPTSTRGADA